MTHHSEPCRVLIIEDEYLLGDDLAKALRLLGVHVIGPITEFSDAMSVELDGFDVAVIDINLRGHSAYPIADECMRMGKPFIFTTGYGEESIPHRFRHVQRWEKPYEIEKVTANVAELCARAPGLITSAA
ncbi:response regulator [Bradyrhizobium sp. CB82]|uniref:response regulator n=1 Tax=Bradyrhizobium sp. CB82 TaxID=3039159 RepID=UPI0024B07A89|nr:response regulator [Bradyrhizobium sp. CB82]WFU45005.1 response regulator [Bradyrhizobium sp. CB82]